MTDSKQDRLLLLCDNIIFKLNDALNILRKASNWGIVDILGGGMFTTIMKHNNLSKARSLISQAEVEMNNLYDQLDERERRVVIGDADIHCLLTIADFLYDGLLSDILVQKRIGDIKNKVSYVIDQVEEIKNNISFNVE